MVEAPTPPFAPTTAIDRPTGLAEGLAKTSESARTKATTSINLIDFGCDIQAALESPRWLSGRFGLHEPRDTLHIEARFPKATIDELERRGHILDRWGDWNEFAGHAHGIVVDPESGMRYGGSDPRSDGAAIGY